MFLYLSALLHLLSPKEMNDKDSVLLLAWEYSLVILLLRRSWPIMLYPAFNMRVDLMTSSCTLVFVVWVNTRGLLVV